MSNMRFERPRRNKENKGFYLALVGCLAAIVAVTWTAVGNLDTVLPEDTATSESYASEGDQTEEAGASPNQYIDGFDWDEAVTEEYNDVMSEISSAQASSEKAATSDAAERETAQANTAPVSSSVSSAVSSKESTSSASKENTQSYMLPIGNEISKEYSGGELVYSMTMGDWRVHEGVDFKAEKDEMVRAVGDGKVLDIVEDPLYGTTVVIDHGDFEAHYCGLVKNVSVEKDQDIKIGDDVGSIGEVPCESVEELHLHFGIKKGDKWVDPIEALRK